MARLHREQEEAQEPERSCQGGQEALEARTQQGTLAEVFLMAARDHLEDFWEEVQMECIRRGIEVGSPKRGTEMSVRAAMSVRLGPEVSSEDSLAGNGGKCVAQIR